jgi:hypothetical protein
VPPFTGASLQQPNLFQKRQRGANIIADQIVDKAEAEADAGNPSSGGSSSSSSNPRASRPRSLQTDHGIPNYRCCVYDLLPEWTRIFLKRGFDPNMIARYCEDPSSSELLIEALRNVPSQILLEHLDPRILPANIRDISSTSNEYVNLTEQMLSLNIAERPTSMRKIAEKLEKLSDQIKSLPDSVKAALPHLRQYSSKAGTLESHAERGEKK